MAYGNKMKDNEMNLVYKYYGNFTAKKTICLGNWFLILL